LVERQAGKLIPNLGSPHPWNPLEAQQACCRVKDRLSSAFGPPKGVEHRFFHFEMSLNAKFQVSSACPFVGNFENNFRTCHMRIAHGEIGAVGSAQGRQDQQGFPLRIRKGVRLQVHERNGGIVRQSRGFAGRFPAPCSSRVSARCSKPIAVLWRERAGFVDKGDAGVDEVPGNPEFSESERSITGKGWSHSWLGTPWCRPSRQEASDARV